jgi:hypothetical protein
MDTKKKSVCLELKKSVKAMDKTEKEELNTNNINVDKEASTASFQRKPQSKSVRYGKQLARPYRAPRMGTRATRRKKI